MDLALTIDRTGTFAVHFRGSNATQCGATGTRVLHYRVRIGCDERHLNPNGFIIDNNDIQAYFDRVYNGVQDFESCERIAARACRDFHTMLDETGVEPQFIKVTVSGSPAAGLTAVWQRPVVAGPERASTSVRSTPTKEVANAVSTFPAVLTENPHMRDVPGMRGIRALDLSTLGK